MTELLKNHPLKNDYKNYRLETIVIDNYNTSYKKEKSYIRKAEVYYLEKKKEEFIYQILVTDFDFSDDDNAMGKFLKQIAYLFDELELGIDEEGNIISVHNINFLRLRWMKIIDKLSKVHKGTAVDNYFSQITTLLENEEQLIKFLESYSMFGLLFNGLLQPFDVQRKRESAEGFTEIVTHTKKNGKVVLTISPENLDQTEIDYFGGLFVYEKDHYEEGFVEIKKNNIHLKHSLLWIG